MKLVALLVSLVLAGCVQRSAYNRITDNWTRQTKLEGGYQQILQLAAIYKSQDWRLAHAQKDAAARGLTGAALEQRLAQAKADAAGPIEVVLLVTTWERRENDLDRGKRSVWRVRMLDAAGNEIEPIEIIRDKRPVLTIRAEFPSMGDFATAYIARFKRPDAPQELRLRMSSERGGVEVAWPPEPR